MPAHNTATSFIGKRLSNGQPVEPHDVTGNDLVDELAKQIARRDALPRSQVRMLREQAARLRQAAIWIGRATAYANHCPLDALVAVDPDGKRRYVRDSDAVQARRATERKRKAECSATVTSAADVNQAAFTATAAAAIRTESRYGTAQLATVTSAAAAWYSGRAKRARLAQQLDTARSEALLRNWLDNRAAPLATAAISAAERMEAMRARIVEKQRR